MPSRINIRNYLLDTRLITGRLVWVSMLMMLLVTVLILRVIYLQVINHDRFTTMSQENRIRLATIVPVRGNIYDRKGRIIAMNSPVHNLEVIPAEVEDFDLMFSNLRQLVSLSDELISKFHRMRKQSSRYDSVLLKHGLEEAEMARFAVNQIRFPGVSIKGNLSRYYPQGPSTAHFTGYVGRISDSDLKQIDNAAYRGMHYIGKLGIEASHEQSLRGEIGFEHIETNAHGQTIRVISRTPAVAGRDLHLSVDLGLQKAAMRALGQEKGAIVAIEPATGDVLAFASMPTYDANLFVNGIDHTSYALLREDENKPLINRALNGRYAPGSTIKGLVGLAMLNQGIDADQTVFCPGWFSFPNSKHKYRCWRRGGHGLMNLASAIEQSCDVFFYQISLALGIDGIHDYLVQYGLGRQTGIDLNYEPTALVPSKSWKKQVKGSSWYRGETVISAIGQGYMLATPLQLAVATATIANRGKYIQPRMVKGYGDPEDDFRYQPLSVSEPVIINQPPEQFQKVIDAMTAVVHGNRGTARKIGQTADYKIAGKTGTSQVIGIAQNQRYDAETLDKKFHDHALFIAFAPVDDPQIALAVVVENGGGGSRTAAPMAKVVMDFYFENRNLPGDYDEFYVSNDSLLSKIR